MENKRTERIMYNLMHSNYPFIVDIELPLNNCIKINANCSQEELEGEDVNGIPSWYKELKPGYVLIIDLNNSTIEQQRRFRSIIKDRIYKNFKIDTNNKIVIYSSKENIVDEEILGYVRRI